MQYHVAATGESAICKAKPGNCPLGGKHFPTRDAADFFIETRAALGLNDAATVETLKRKVNVELELAKLSNEDLNRRFKAVTKLEIAERFGEEKDIDAAAAKLEEMGEDVNDPTWSHANLQRELVKRNPQWGKSSKVAAAA
jgi:bifunctional DNA-binding transcriptional regulator/antitoxin component of YhaV-PrlF toxin-antitoxin module